MGFEVDSSQARDRTGVAEGFGFPDFSGSSASELLGLMGEVDSIRRRAEGYLVGLIVRYGEIEGQSAAATVCHQFGISAYKARQLARTAEGLAVMPDVLTAVQEGHISAEQGAMVAESHKRVPMSGEAQQELLALGGWQDHDEFKKTVAAGEDRRRADDGMSRIERQRARRSLKVFDSASGMVMLYAELDQVAGDRVKTAIGAMSTKMLVDDIAFDPVRTFEQRNADALVTLITAQPANMSAADPADVGSSGVRSQKTVLVVSADYDAIEGKLVSAGLMDGSPIDLDEIRRLACDAAIVPMIFSTEGQPLYMGRAQRAVTKAQRLALYRRDRGCVGCGMRPQICDAHHIVPWECNGTTDIDNLVLLCPRCHKKVHKHGYTVETCVETGSEISPESGRFTLRPPPSYGLPPPRQSPKKQPVAA
ncbi:MAG: DUF222 domain-containing protein [Acidimicrobiia bacterium]|nr:DUF222 domain-containing protein [Acidimicrobiia bacterium]MYC57427.1 DUF222 domain-containing protein [Acidimicrobiia bacterium]MYI30826.1 DUF222 domain-containing protein [Acidimicrobiia bacterium]